MSVLRKRTSLFVVIVMGIALTGALAGCGGSDETAPPPSAVEEPATESLTKADLISQADGICAEVNAAVGLIDSTDDGTQTARVTQKADLYGGLANRLEALGTPSDGEAPDAVIESLQSLADADNGSGDDLIAFQEAATEYGLTQCAEAPTSPAQTAGTDDGSATEPDAGTESGEGDAYVAPEPTAPPASTPVTPPSTGRGVNPDTTPPAGGGTGGSGGGSSGGIGPG